MTKETQKDKILDTAIKVGAVLVISTSLYLLGRTIKTSAELLAEAITDNPIRIVDFPTIDIYMSDLSHDFRYN